MEVGFESPDRQSCGYKRGSQDVDGRDFKSRRTSRNPKSGVSLGKVATVVATRRILLESKMDHRASEVNCPALPRIYQVQLSLCDLVDWLRGYSQVC